MVKKKAKQSSQDDQHTIPGQVNPADINEELGMMRYVEKNTPDEKVLFLEKVVTGQVFDTRMDIWNVQTDKNRYWAITNPTGLYSQALFPSLDYALTFHVGLAYRKASNQRQDETEQEQDQLALPWRRWEHAVVALDNSTEPEQFQAVGILCRECLLALVKTIISDEMIPVDQERPNLADFNHWTDLIANSIAQGSNADEIRSYLISISKTAWQWVNWLTRAENATRFEGNIAIEATEYVLMAFGAALLRLKNETLDP